MPAHLAYSPKSRNTRLEEYPDMTVTVSYSLNPTKAAFANDDYNFTALYSNEYSFYADQIYPDVVGLTNGGYVEATNVLAYFSDHGDVYVSNSMEVSFYDKNYVWIASRDPFLNDGNGEDVGQPSVTQLANGNVLVVWQSISEPST